MLENADRKRMADLDVRTAGEISRRICDEAGVTEVFSGSVTSFMISRSEMAKKKKLLARCLVNTKNIELWALTGGQDELTRVVGRTMHRQYREWVDVLFNQCVKLGEYFRKQEIEDAEVEKEEDKLPF